MPSVSAPGFVFPADWKRALLGISVGCLLVIIALWSSVVAMAVVWRSNSAYQFAWLIPLLLAYLLGWHHRSVVLEIHLDPGFSGLAVAVLASLIWVVAELVNIDVAKQFALVVAIQGVLMAAMGWRTYWRLTPFLWLAFLMVPSGDFFQPLLRLLTVKVIAAFSFVLDLPYQVDGYQIRVGNNDYVVLKECSGLPYFLLAGFLGYAFGLLLYRSFLKVMALASFGAVLGVLCNVLRVCGIVLIDWLQGTQMPLSAHANVQWIALAICLGLLFLLLSRLDEEKTVLGNEIVQVKPVGLRLIGAPVSAGFVVFLAVIGTTCSLASNSSSGGKLSYMFMPRQLVGWDLETPEPEWSTDLSGEKRSLAMVYRRNQEILEVRIVEAMTPSAKLLESAVAPGDPSIWHENLVARRDACAGATCMKILHTIWEHGQNEERRNVYSTFALAEYFTPSKLLIRINQGWNRLIGGGERPRLIGLTLRTAASSDEFAELVRMFQTLQSTLEFSPE